MCVKWRVRILFRILNPYITPTLSNRSERWECVKWRDYRNSNRNSNSNFNRRMGSSFSIYRRRRSGSNGLCERCCREAVCAAIISTLCLFETHFRNIFCSIASKFCLLNIYLTIIQFGKKPHLFQTLHCSHRPHAACVFAQLDWLGDRVMLGAYLIVVWQWANLASVPNSIKYLHE